MDDVKAAYMALTVRNHAHTAHVASTSDHDDIAGIKLCKAGDLALFDIELDCVIDLDGWVGVAYCAAVVGYNVRDTARPDGHLFHLAKLVGRLLECDAVDCEASLNIVQKTEIFTRLFDPDDVCALRLGDISSRTEGADLGSQ